MVISNFFLLLVGNQLLAEIHKYAVMILIHVDKT